MANEERPTDGIWWTLAGGIAMQLLGALVLGLTLDESVALAGWALVAAGGVLTLAATVGYGVYLGLRAHAASQAQETAAPGVRR